MIELNDKHKTFLVTGGAGFIGSHVCEELLKQNKKVICLNNTDADKARNVKEFFDNPNFIFIKESVVDFDSIRPHFDGVDIVLHQAASRYAVCREDPLKDLMVNAWGSWCVFEASRQAGVKKVVYASTGSTMGGKPESFYGVSKLAGETYLRAFGAYHPEFKYTSLRYNFVYGPKQDYSGVIPIFIRQIYNNEPTIVFGDGKQVRHFTEVKDVVNANFFATIKPETNNKMYNVASRAEVSISDLAKLIHKLMGKEENIVFGPHRPGDVGVFIVDDNLEKLGFVYQNDFETGLEATIGWYLKEISGGIV